MRVQPKTALVFASPLLLAIAGAYFQWLVFGLPHIPPQAQPPPMGEPQGFPSWLRITHYVNLMFLVLGSSMISETTNRRARDRRALPRLANRQNENY